MPLTASPRPSSWSLMELPPFPACAGWLAGFHRASPSTPLDAYGYVARERSTGGGVRRSRVNQSDGVTRSPANLLEVSPSGRLVACPGVLVGLITLSVKLVERSLFRLLEGVA